MTEGQLPNNGIELTALRAAAYPPRSPLRRDRQLADRGLSHPLLLAAISMCTILRVVALLFLGAPAADAQPDAKPWRIGYLSAGFQRPDLEKAFRARLRDLGHVEGQGVLIESRWADGNFERLPQLAREIVKLRPDVVVAVSGLEVEAVQRASTTVPLVMILTPDPVGRGLVKSLARPGGNVTGLTLTTGPELYGKRLELLRELVPGATRIGLLVNAGSHMTSFWVPPTEAAARTLGLRVHVFEARTRTDLDGTFSMMKQHRIQAVRVPSDPLFNGVRHVLVELAAQARVPVLYDLRDFVEAGGLAAYGPSYPELFGRAAEYVDRILKGQRPVDLPIEQPTKFEFVLNRKAAAALGLTIPPSLLLRADHVLE